MRRFLPLFALLSGLALLGGCSRLDLLYDQFDRLVTWRIDRYLDLDREQKDWLKPRLQEHLAWHCQTQLPQLADWLQHDSAALAAGRLDGAALNQRIDALEQELQLGASAMAPTVAGLLAQLDAEQVEHLREKLADEQRDLIHELLGPPLAEQIERRQETTEERLERWFGPLNARQQALVADWAQRRGQHNRLWLDSRARWQQALLDSLAERDSADFEVRIATLMADRQQYWSEAYRQSFAEGQRELVALLEDLLASSDARQRAHLHAELTALREDIVSLECATPAAEVANR